MERRTLMAVLAGGFLAAPLVIEAQQTRPLRIGWLSMAPHPFISSFRAGLRDLGYVEGQSVVIDERYAEGQPDRLPGLVWDLIARRVDVFVTSGGAAALAAKDTTTVPIVSITSNHVGVGLVRSLAHPGGNVTGLELLSADRKSVV